MNYSTNFSAINGSSRFVVNFQLWNPKNMIHSSSVPQDTTRPKGNDTAMLDDEIWLIFLACFGTKKILRHTGERGSWPESRHPLGRWISFTNRIWILQPMHNNHSRKKIATLWFVKNYLWISLIIPWRTNLCTAHLNRHWRSWRKSDRKRLRRSMLPTNSMPCVERSSTSN